MELNEEVDMYDDYDDFDKKIDLNSFPKNLCIFIYPSLLLLDALIRIIVIDCILIGW